MLTISRILTFLLVLSIMIQSMQYTGMDATDSATTELQDGDRVNQEARRDATNWNEVDWSDVDWSKITWSRPLWE